MASDRYRGVANDLTYIGGLAPGGPIFRTFGYAYMHSPLTGSGRKYGSKFTHYYDKSDKSCDLSRRSPRFAQWNQMGQM